MILGVPSSPGSQRVGKQGTACEERQAVQKRGWGVCTCVYSWGLEVWEGGREGRVQNFLSCGARKRQFLTILPSIFWGNQDAEARVGCEQQVSRDQEPGRE